MSKSKRKFIVAAILVCFCALFAMITYWTPLAGDDWGYALTGMRNNPFVAAYNQYFNWSGRILSELWGYIVAPNKWLWNILNPAIFTLIFCFMLNIIAPKRNEVLVALLALFLILSVKDYVRMQTYTWIMGTTYVIPLLLLIIYSYILKLMILNDEYQKWMVPLCMLLNAAIPLYMENAAVALLIANLLTLIFVSIYDKKNIKHMILFTIIGIISLAICRLSPGASYRLVNEHPDFAALSFFEKIASNWKNFIEFTFTDNKYLICGLSLVMMGFVFSKRSAHKGPMWTTVVFEIIFFLGFIQSISANLGSHLPFLSILYDLETPGCVLVVSLLLAVYLIAVFGVILLYLDFDHKYFALYLLMVGGSANLCMLISPIFDSRSSIYTIYFLIMLAMLFLENIEMDIRIEYGVILVLALLSLMQARTYLYKYHLVDSVNKERMEQIYYYQDHPEDKEAYIVRMPIMTIHSADVEEWDTFHREVFIQYFNLDPDIELHFYYKDQY